MSGLRGFVQSSFPDVQLLTDCHRMFLRQIIARQCVSRFEAREILQEILDTYENCTDGRRNLSLHTIIEELNKALNIVRFRIIPVRAEADGQVYVIFANEEAQNVELAQGGTNILSNVFRVLFHQLTVSSEPLTYAKAQNLRLSAQGILTNLGNEANGTRTNTNDGGDGKEAGGGLARSISTKQWNDSLDTLIRQQWLTVANQEIFIGPRASAELRSRISTSVGPCVVCRTPCVTPDRQILEDKQERKHICCANNTIDKSLHDKDILVPNLKYNTEEDYENNTQTTTATTLKSSSKGSKKMGTSSGTKRGRKSRRKSVESEDEEEEEEEETDEQVPSNQEEEEVPSTQRRGRRR